jgi:uncharacterized membrane protein
METRKRSLVKALSYRVIGFMVTFVTTWLFTGSFRVGATVGGVDCIIKICMFYGHERLWRRVQWGVTQTDQVYQGGGI